MQTQKQHSNAILKCYEITIDSNVMKSPETAIAVISKRRSYTANQTNH